MSKIHENSNSIERFDNITKSSHDKRQYRGILLNNQLKCLLISDPFKIISAASIDVYVGSMLEPKDLPGLAHFCEHMLFMGSEKYPSENHFHKFIQDHSGYTNAYTSAENTNYHFEVDSGHFKQSLDIFAQFFIAPKFHESTIEREINAVDSEFQKNLNDDSRRIHQLERSSGRSDHPYNKFRTGNLETLKTEPEKHNINIRGELISFHSKYYSSNIMQLCLQGKESLDELEKYAVDMFSLIPNKNVQKTVFSPDPFRRDLPATILYVVPIQDLKQMTMSWVIPDFSHKYDSNPPNYLSHLVGHESEGSLLSELKKKGWCNNLIADGQRVARGFQFFTINFGLTDKGIENVEEIMKHVFQYLNMLRKEKPQKWIFNEMNDLGKINFLFKEETQPIDFVSHISANMQFYAIEDILSADFYQTKFDPEAIENILEHLTPEKMKVKVISKKYQGKCDKIEKWHGTEYKKMTLRKKTLESLNECGLNEAFKLPEKNPFIPSDLTLVEHEKISKFPRLVHLTTLSRLWYKEDSRFNLPKAYIKFEIRNPLSNETTTNLNMTNMFTMLLSDSLNENCYYANLAELDYSLEINDYGLEITFNGYNDKMGVLINKVFETISSFQIDPLRFKIIKENYKLTLMNSDSSQPYQQSIEYLNLLISEKGWTHLDLLNTIDDFTLEDLQKYIPQLLTQNVYIESFMYGNLSEKTALEYLKIVENSLKATTNKDNLKPLKPIHLKNLRQVKLPDGSDTVFIKENKMHKTNAINVYLQHAGETARNNVLIELFQQIIKESLYNVLRTQEKLGYVVSSFVNKFGGVSGVEIIVQSDKSPGYLNKRIENFLNNTKKNIENMTDEEFQTHMLAVALSKLGLPNSMFGQFYLYYNEISSHQYDFNRGYEEFNELRKLSKDDLWKFFKKFISSKSKSRRKLAVYVQHSELSSEMFQESIKEKLVQDLEDWRKTLKLYPNKKEYIIYAAK